MSSFFDKFTNQDAVAFADKVGDVFKSLPNLPSGLVEFLVKITPYFAILSAIISIIVGPFAALAMILSLLTLNPIAGLAMLVSTIVMLLSAALMFMAFNPLKNREHKGWMYLFWAEVLYVGSSLIGLLSGDGIIGAIVGAAISFYVLFQMRPFYNPMAEVVAKTVKK